MIGLNIRDRSSIDLSLRRCRSQPPISARMAFTALSETAGLKLMRYFPEVDPIVWTKFRRFLDGAAGCPGGGPKAAIHSGLESALGSHPCVALSSYQAPLLYGSRE